MLSGKEQFLTDEQKQKIKQICEEKYLLEFKKIEDLDNLTFEIKDYQRGYRWTNIEVEALLEDIEGVNIDDTSEGYCLQPIVVRRVKGNEFELIDGQQRLTTLDLIIQELKINGHNIEFSWKIKNSETEVRPIDKYFIDNAKKVVDSFFCFKKESKKRGKKNKNVDISAFCQKLGKIFFIWYEEKDNGQSVLSEDIFRKLNEGKIALTNAELFKALLLNPDNIKNMDKNAFRKQEQIAFEWDKIEAALQNDDFWFFLCSNSEKDNEMMRIDYVIELFARTIVNQNKLEFGTYKPDKDRFSFLVIQKMIDDSQDKTKKVEEIWEAVVEVCNTLLTWYRDFELYHLIGFLTSCTKQVIGSHSLVPEKIGEIYNEIASNKNDENDKSLGKVKKLVRKAIFSEIFNGQSDERFKNAVDKAYKASKNNKTKEVGFISQIKYNGEGLINSKNNLKNILLFSNIYPYLASIKEDEKNEEIKQKRKNVQRFSFSKFYNGKWDIEHIQPQTLNNDISDLSEADQKQKIEEATIYAKNHEFPEIEGQNNKEKWKRFVEIYNAQTDDDECNSITNLVLLDSATNRSYKNSFFSEKRRVIVSRDYEGVFVPPCTKNVFLKYFTDLFGDGNESNNYDWTKNDSDAYGLYLADILFKIREWGS